MDTNKYLFRGKKISVYFYNAPANKSTSFVRKLMPLTRIAFFIKSVMGDKATFCSANEQQAPAFQQRETTIKISFPLLIFAQ